MFHPAPAPSQVDALAIVERASKRILRFLQRRAVITAPGDGEVTVVTDETMGDKDPLLARLLAAATAGAPVPSEPRACPLCPCPTRLRRARRLCAQTLARTTASFSIWRRGWRLPQLTDVDQAGWRRPSCVFETASPGHSNRGKSRPGVPHPRAQDRHASARQGSLTRKNPVRNGYGQG
jgi:hypothetical protein